MQEYCAILIDMDCKFGMGISRSFGVVFVSMFYEKEILTENLGDIFWTT